MARPRPKRLLPKPPLILREHDRRVPVKLKDSGLRRARGIAPSSTVLLFRAMKAVQVNYAALAAELSKSLGTKIQSSAASQLLTRFKVALEARELRDQGLNIGQIATRLNLHRITITKALKDPRYQLPPKGPRVSISELATKMGMTEAEVRKLLEWNPTQ